MRAPRQARIIILCDSMALILILGVLYKSDSGRSDNPVRAFTLFQCTPRPSHEPPLFDKQGSFERPRGTFRTTLNERQLFLVCTDRVSRQPDPRVDRSQDGRAETRIPALE